MRLEDKELEGPELERAQRLEGEQEREAEELPMLAHEEVRDAELAHRGRLFDALQAIMAREQLTVSLLHLPQREAHALEFLQAAVTGRSTNMGEFVFAEDRRAMLEQALAVLQENLTHGSPSELAELHAKFHSLTSQVGELRQHLLDLEDAQDDLIEPKDHQAKKAETDDADKPGEPEATDAERDDSVSGFIASALEALAQVAGTDAETLKSSLHGTELPAQPKSPSTLSGAEVAAPARAPSTLVGAELPASPAPPSTLAGPEPAAEPARPSTLVGPDRPEDPPRPSTLAEPPQRTSSPSLPVPARKSAPTITIPPKGKPRG